MPVGGALENGFFPDPVGKDSALEDVNLDHELESDILVLLGGEEGPGDFEVVAVRDIEGFDLAFEGQLVRREPEEGLSLVDSGVGGGEGHLYSQFVLVGEQSLGDVWALLRPDSLGHLFVLQQFTHQSLVVRVTLLLVP